MGRTDDRGREAAHEAGPTPAGAAPSESRDGPRPPQADATAPPGHRAADPPAQSPPAKPPEAGARSHPWRKRLLLAAVVAGLAVGGYVFLAPRVETMLNTVSTDDAFVNSHVTF